MAAHTHGRESRPRHTGSDQARSVPARLALGLAVSAVGSLAGVFWTSSPAPGAASMQQEHVLLLRRHGSLESPRGVQLGLDRLVRAPGDQGVGGHGIGGEFCWMQSDEKSGLNEWVCAPSEETLAARVHRARLSGLLSFGSRAPAGGYARDYQKYGESLPPWDWGENYDGTHFVNAFSPSMSGVASYPRRDKDYYERISGGVPTPLPFDVDEVHVRSTVSLCVRCTKSCPHRLVQLRRVVPTPTRPTYTPCPLMSDACANTGFRTNFRTRRLEYECLVPLQQL